MAMIGAADAAPAADAPVLEPTGKWLVMFVGDRCLLTRDYGTGADAVTLAYRPLPLSDSAEWRLLTNTQKKSYVVGEGKVRLLPGGTEAVGTSFGRRFDDGARRATTMGVRQSEMAALLHASELEMRVSGERMVRVRLVRIAPALRALKTCNDEVIETWGVDLAVQARVATPADGSTGGFIKSEDFPAAGRMAAAGANSTYLFKVDIDGRVTDCKVINGEDALFDEAGRAAILKRGRYRRPALDAAGVPIASYQTVNVKWRSLQVYEGRPLPTAADIPLTQPVPYPY
ncbi:hypothetical protein ACFONA_05910 [Sphingomonas hylomeconis]|uniref:TonB C-terminal domain-containing protein n=2 Tax=Sphingomonas hylomeconis TaxID=1395958 RepID=A0ABV7STP7_9SPHN